MDALLRQSPKRVQHNCKTSSFPDANWLSVASAGTLCAWKNLRLDSGHNNSVRSPAFSSFFSWQRCQQRSYDKARATADPLSERLSPCHPSPSAAIRVRWRSRRQSCAGAGAAPGMLTGSRCLVSLDTSHVHALEFGQGFLLCEKRLLLFSIPMQRGVFQERFTPWTYIFIKQKPFYCTWG